MNTAAHLHFNHLVAAHRAAQAIVDRMTEEEVPDGKEFDGAVETETLAMDAAATDPDINEETLAYILERQIHDFGEPCHTKEFGSLAIAVQTFLKRRRA